MPNPPSDPPDIDFASTGEGRAQLMPLIVIAHTHLMIDAVMRRRMQEVHMHMQLAQ